MFTVPNKSKTTVLDYPETLVLDNPEISSLFNNRHIIVYLKPFFIRPHSLQEASKKLNISISSYYYWIKRFQKLGLLTIAYEKKRAGSNIKYYRATAKKIIVILDNGYLSLKKFYDSYTIIYDLNNLVVKNILKTVIHNNESFGIMLHIDEREKYYTSPIIITKDGKKTTVENKMLAPDAPAVLATGRSMRLKNSDAKEFQQKLVDLINEYEKKTVIGQKKYLVKITLSPEK